MNGEILYITRRLGFPSSFGARSGLGDFLEQYPDGIYAETGMGAPAGWDSAAVWFGGGSERAAYKFERMVAERNDVSRLFRTRVSGVLLLTFLYRLKRRGVTAIPVGGGARSVLLEESALGNEEVALVVSTPDGLRFVRTADAGEVDFTAYPLKPYVRFHRGKNGRVVVMHAAEPAAGTWSMFNRYRIRCDTTADGSFTWSIRINGSNRSGSVSWAAGETLDDIVSRMTGVATYLVFSHEDGEDFIRAMSGGYTDSELTLSDAVGASVEDLSKFTRIGGVQQPETHRTWEAENVHAMFPSLGFLPPTTVQYARNGYNLSYRCGASESRYKEYYRTSGSASYLAETAVSSRMRESAFNALDGSGVEEQQALYDKYGGSWDAYMEASMVQLDSGQTGGIEYLSYDNGDDQTGKLLSVETMDYDGSYVCPFTAASKCGAVTDADVYGGSFHLPTVHEYCVFMNDAHFDAVNAAFAVLSANGVAANSLYRTYYYWSVARYTNYDAWFYDGHYGTSNRYRLYSSYRARPLAYLNA